MTLECIVIQFEYDTLAGIYRSAKVIVHTDSAGLSPGNVTTAIVCVAVYNANVRELALESLCPPLTASSPCWGTTLLQRRSIKSAFRWSLTRQKNLTFVSVLRVDALVLLH